MKRVLFAIIVVISLRLHLEGAQLKTDRESAGLKGPVRSIRVERGTFFFKSGKYVEKCCGFFSNMTFNPDGTIVEESLGFAIVDDGPVTPLKIKPEYDAKGNLIEESSFKSDGSLVSKKIHTYNSVGDKKETLYYSANGSLYRKEIFNYDDKHNLIEQIVYYGDGTPSYRETFSDYDSHNNWTKEIRWDWESENNKGYWEPFIVYYRKITYY